MVVRHRRTTLCLVAGLSLACAVTAPPESQDVGTLTNGMGEIAGEVTDHSVILQSRLTTTAGFVDGDVRGAPGVAAFEVSASRDFVDSTTTEWLEATAEGDFIVKTTVGDLGANTEYFYRLVYGLDRETVVTGPTRSFSTHAGARIAREASFVVVTGMNYHQFYRSPTRAYAGPDRDLGYPAIAAMHATNPDFFVATGDKTSTTTCRSRAAPTRR